MEKCWKIFKYAKGLQKAYWVTFQNRTNVIGLFLYLFKNVSNLETVGKLKFGILTSRWHARVHLIMYGTSQQRSLASTNTNTLMTFRMRTSEISIDYIARARHKLIPLNAITRFPTPEISLIDQRHVGFIKFRIMHRSVHDRDETKPKKDVSNKF